MLGRGIFQFSTPANSEQFDQAHLPPKKLTETLIQEYADAIMGKGCTSVWTNQNQSLTFNFGRPSIRLSGGEFYTWPHKINGNKTSEDERLFYQNQLLNHIRKTLPEYDIWILTNGRFAESDEKTDRIIQYWAIDNNEASESKAKTRMTISVDPFHHPPKKSTIEQMLTRLWKSTQKYKMPAPYIYSVTNKKVFLVGRALEKFENGMNALNSDSTFYGDPNNLIESNGCNELKGFVCKLPNGFVLGNNIVVNYTGHLAYCCVCVGDYGDFVSDPSNALKQMLRDPVSLMLRRGSSAAEFLNTAVDLDPTIKVFGESKIDRSTGSTCYQVLSGKRVMI